ncbi:hypothetical protein MUK42_06808 [Musa troglodytarum]|uniref:Uncharacterized protein n=1 Tax=Musa troglodytarum TaxID=320322 RepID=A0A9E7HPH7_9LILI|nr:hypothetical protein MUK42_06808 [Musa troglodytarum]
MLSSSSDLPKSSLQIEEDDKFYGRLLSKESSAANPSSRAYYGVATVAVPFVWESQPGTPKHSSSAAAMPPLTPPPSYSYSPRSTSSTKNPKSGGCIRAMLPRLSLTSSSSSSVSLSSSSVSSSPSSSSSGRPSHSRRPSSPQSSFLWSRGDDEESDDGSPTSILCFGTLHRVAGLPCP